MTQQKEYEDDLRIVQPYDRNKSNKMWIEEYEEEIDEDIDFLREWYRTEEGD